MVAVDVSAALLQLTLVKHIRNRQPRKPLQTTLAYLIVQGIWGPTGDDPLHFFGELRYAVYFRVRTPEVYSATAAAIPTCPSMLRCTNQLFVNHESSSQHFPHQGALAAACGITAYPPSFYHLGSEKAQARRYVQINMPGLSTTRQAHTSSYRTNTTTSLTWKDKLTYPTMPRGKEKKRK